jgi:U3 small nucleolar RNA-associated protein 20
MTDGSHKLAVPGKYAEDEEILRVPVALAMVKLLQQLPRNALDKNLPG